MNNSTVCPQCGREAINGWLPCKCDHRYAMSICGICGTEHLYGGICPNFWDAKHSPPQYLQYKSQDAKLDKIIALLEQIKERL